MVMSRRWNLLGAKVEAVRPSSPFLSGVRMKTRVLIVDDEPIARRGIRRYLAEHDGIEIVGEAANGISAVKQINELHPDIVFLDVLMPDLDGFGVIENVEPSTGPAPVYIFVTAHDAHAIRAYTPPATVTCCGKPWHTWKRSWRHTTSSECENRPS